MTGAEPGGPVGGGSSEEEEPEELLQEGIGCCGVLPISVGGEGGYKPDGAVGGYGATGEIEERG